MESPNYNPIPDDHKFFFGAICAIKNLIDFLLGLDNDLLNTVAVTYIGLMENFLQAIQKQKQLNSSLVQDEINRFHSMLKHNYLSDKAIGKLCGILNMFAGYTRNIVDVNLRTHIIKLLSCALSRQIHFQKTFNEARPDKFGHVDIENLLKNSHEFVELFNHEGEL